MGSLIVFFLACLVGSLTALGGLLGAPELEQIEGGVKTCALLLAAVYLRIGEAS